MTTALRKPCAVMLAGMLALSFAWAAPAQADEGKYAPPPELIAIDDTLVSADGYPTEEIIELPAYDGEPIAPLSAMPDAGAPIVSDDASIGTLSTDITTQKELQEALIGASNGDTIELTQDIVLDGAGLVFDPQAGTWSDASDVPIYIPRSLTAITIDGNGYRIGLADGYDGLHFDAEVDGSASRTVTLANAVLVGHNEGIDPSTALDARTAGGGMHVGGNFTTLIWNNVVMTGVHGIGSGGGIFNYGSAVKLNDCTIEDVSATASGGFYSSGTPSISYGGSLTMVGGSASGTRSGGNGGFALLSRGAHNLSGATFDDCYAAGYGGVLSNSQGSSTLTLSNCAFNGNAAGDSGGAIQVQNGNHTITDCTFDGNTAGVDPGAYMLTGGAIYQNGLGYDKYSVLERCTFTNNSAPSGGALSGEGFALIDARFISNSATNGDGGAMRCNPYTYFTIKGAYFEDNYAATKQLNWDLDNPRSCIPSGLVFSPLAAHYKANVTGITGITAQAPDAMVAPTHAMNNYDISCIAFTTYFLTPGTGTIWSDKGTDVQRVFNSGTYTVSGLLESRGAVATHEDGKRLLGWVFPIGELTSGGVPVEFEGYGTEPYVVSYGVNDKLLKAYGYDDSAIFADDDYVIQGSHHYFMPLWEEQVTLIYHTDSSTQLTDPDGVHGMLTDVTAKRLADLGGSYEAPENMRLAGWATTENEVEGETLILPGATFTAQTADLDDGEMHLYARYTDAPAEVGLDVARLFGEHRYETSRQVSTYERATEETIILASGDDAHFPDALTASSLSGHLGNAPIVLTATDSLSPDAQAAIDGDLAAKKVIIIGDQHAISNDVESAVKALPNVTEVQRLGGDDRQETAEIINREVGAARSNTAVIAKSSDFPDSLTISSWSAATKSPIFLTEFGQTSLTDETKEALAQGGFDRILVLGDEYSVPASVVAQAKAAAGVSDAQIIRLGGEDRYHTSTLVASWTTAPERGDAERLAWSKPAIARGDKHADSLTGGALQGRDKSPILLTDGATPNERALALLAQNDGSVSELRFFGDEWSISHATTKAFITTLTWDTVTWKPNDGVAVDLS